MLDKTQKPARITIDKGITLAPHGNTGRRDNTKYPFAEMQIGDSFAFPAGTRKETASKAACAAGKRLGRKFAVRNVGPGEYRVWRIA